MELRERLLEQAVWCELKTAMSGDLGPRLEHVAQDLRDAATEIQSLSRYNASNAAEARTLRLKVNELEEQLQIAKTEASDVTSFREREHVEYKHVLHGMRLAIQAMCSAMKGGA